jgi:radical SAM protein with 4Fe4S-binding SPASM domain
MEDTRYPFFLQWHLTEKCNLRCRHCYQQSPSGEMVCEDVCQAIDDIAVAIENWALHYEIEVAPSIHFTGGEPFLRGDLFDILHHARRRGFTTSLLSNGTLITGDIARKIREAEVEDVQVSLDGMETVHDSIRGKGVFGKTITGCRNLVAEGIELNLNLTISSLNYRELGRVVQLAGDLGASSVGFSRLVPCGRGQELSRYSLSPEQISSLGKVLTESDSGSSVVLTSRDPLFNMINITDDADIAGVDFPIGGCAAGVFGVTIAADGAIMPCRRMDLSIGNIKTDDFRQLWAESPVLVSLRNRQYYHGNCRTCFYWAVCRGCRAIALASARSQGVEDYLGPDPQCDHYRAVEEYNEVVS